MDRICVGLVALGNWGAEHLTALRTFPYINVVAVCYIQEDRVAALGERWHFANGSARAEDVYRRDDIDLVDAVTFEHDHPYSVLGALQADTHVLVGKPVATDLDQARAMQAVAETTDSWLVPEHLLSTTQCMASRSQCPSSRSQHRGQEVIL